MNNPYKDKRWFKILSNKYIWVSLSFIVWMTFLDNYSYFDHRILDKEINELNTPSVKPISIISLMSPSPSDSFLNIFVVIIFSKHININIKAPDSI